MIRAALLAPLQLNVLHAFDPVLLARVSAKRPLRKLRQILAPQHPAMPCAFHGMELMPDSASGKRVIDALCALEQVIQRPAAHP